MNVCEASGLQPLTSDQLNPLIQLMKRISLAAGLLAAAAVAAPLSAQAEQSACFEWSKDAAAFVASGDDSKASLYGPACPVEE